jgi:AraC-like DNA-binding protein
MQIASPATELFSIPTPELLTTLRRSTLSIRRLKSDVASERIVRSVAEDSHLLLFQLRDHPACDFWVESTYRPAAPTAKSTLKVLDMNQSMVGRIVAPYDKLAFHFPRAALDELADDAGGPRISDLHIPADAGVTDTVLARMQDFILEAMARPAQGNRLFTDHLTIALYAHIAHTYGGLRSSPSQRRPAGVLAPWQERRAKAILSTNLAKELSLTQVAELCGLSAAYFSRCFKASTGFTPHGWLQARRIDRAKGLLADPDLALADIATICGFADQSHFTRVFTQRTGTSPGNWRRERRAA